MNISYKRATSAFKKEIEALSTEILKLHVKNEPAFFALESVDLKQIYRTDIFTDHQYFVYVAVDEHDDFAGYVLCRIATLRQKITSGSEAYIYIHEIGVMDQFKNHGIGTGLMNQVKAHGRNLGIFRIELGEWAFNDKAIRFYESLGFQTLRKSMSLSL